MTTFGQIDQALRAKGWRYDRGDEVFRDGDRVLVWEEVIGLAPGTTLGELTSYQDDRYDTRSKVMRG
jgi:hypothetical protein